MPGNMNWGLSESCKTCVVESWLTHINEHRFFECVAKIYRGAMLHSVLSMWCECARQSGNVDATVTLLSEMIGLSEGVLHHTLGRR
jgi:hypothetical protein